MLYLFICGVRIMIKLQIIKWGAFSAEQEKQIVDLHHHYFDLPSKNIIEFLKARDEVHLFFDTSNGQLIGTIGIQWFQFKGVIIMYLGGIVVLEEYQKYGILTKSLVPSVIKTTLRHPFSKRFVMTMATTPDAFRYFAKFPTYWPKPGEPIPEEVQSVFTQFCERYCPGNYKQSDGIYSTRIKGCDFRLQPMLEYKSLARMDRHARWFREKIPDFCHGEQLVVGIQHTFKGYMMLFDAYFKRQRRKWMFRFIPLRFLKTKYLFFALFGLIASSGIGLSLVALSD